LFAYQFHGLKYETPTIIKIRYWPNRTYSFVATTQLTGNCWQCLKFSRCTTVFIVVWGLGKSL